MPAAGSLVFGLSLFEIGSRNDSLCLSGGAFLFLHVDLVYSYNLTMQLTKFPVYNEENSQWN